MLKPVSILALDDVVAPLAQAVQERVAAQSGLDDLVQWRTCDDDPEEAVQSMHAQRQRPDSPLRLREDVGTRELVLVMLAAGGPARTSLLEAARRIRSIYEQRRLASFVSIEILCLLPEAAGTATPDAYAAAYALLKVLSAEEEKPFDEVWLVDATNGSRMHFGATGAFLDVYADAIAGALTYEPELSGALPGIHPRGMHPTFSSFGYASLVFPREVALQRVEARFAAALVGERLLTGTAVTHAQLAAKQFVTADGFALPLSRIGVEGGQSIFSRFRPKSQVSERTRSAEEIIAAVRSELQAFRDKTHLGNLEMLAKQGDETTRDHSALLARTVDETLDHEGYDGATAVLEALVDPLPELRPAADLSPRNLVTEIRSATAALDARLRFVPNTASSDAARKRVRELETLIEDRQVVAETLGPADAARQLASLQEETLLLLRQVPETIFAEERENSAARMAAREGEAVRLSAETVTREQHLRELFIALPRAEQALREALEARRRWLWQQVFLGLAGAVAISAVAWRLHVRPGWWILFVLMAFVAVTAGRYATRIVPPLRDARERLTRLRSQIATADEAKNGAHNDELQFEHEVTHHRTALRVLRAVHDAAKETLDAVRTRRGELETLAASFVLPSLASRKLCSGIVDDDEVDAWYARTIDERKPFAREFPIGRAESRRLPIAAMRQRIASYAATAFGDFRKLTLATAASLLADEAKLARRLKWFAEVSAPLVELREDDLQAQRSMQCDCTLWLDSDDVTWSARLRQRFPESHVRPAPDALSVHVITRVLHYPGYALGAIDYYREQYESAAHPEAREIADLIPPEIVYGARVHAAYEQVLLAQALGIAVVRDAETYLAAAQRLAGSENAAERDRLDDAVVARLEITADVGPELRCLRESLPLTPLDRTVLAGLLRRHTTL